MFVKGKKKNQIFVCLVVSLFCLGVVTRPPLFAQQDFLFEEDSFGSEEEFIDDVDLNEIDIEFEESFNPNRRRGDQYTDDDIIFDETQQLLQGAVVQRRDFLVEERANFVPNILYGVGTGLIIGGWFAFLTANTSRETLRSIGLGIVLGGLMGSVIGSRSIIAPNAPVPRASLPPTEGFDTKNQGMTVSLQWHF